MSSEDKGWLVTVNTERSFTASFTEARAFAMASCRCAGNPALHLAILLTSLLYKSIKLHEGSREASPRRHREPSPIVGSPYLEQAPPFGRPSRAVNAAGAAIAGL
ncbi:unnamed protein product [Cladocopium goreaui]|uniref:Uncharacterized protein n=1 Tax=Cladocopium goreaui TaxID=2562237 RepID=A0A9P1DGA1_9DINO|nr:unnamed protein product [Cladocopium goreaui]